MRYGKRFINKMRMFYQRPIHGVSKKYCKVYFSLYHILKTIDVLIPWVAQFIEKFAKYTKCYVTMTNYEEVTAFMIPINTVEIYNFPHI